MTLLCLLDVLWGQNYLALISQELQTSYRGTQISEKRFAFRGHFNRKIWSHLDFWALLGRNKSYVPRTNSKLPLIGMDNWATGRDTTASGVAKTPSLHEKSTDSYLATSLKILLFICLYSKKNHCECPPHSPEEKNNLFQCYKTCNCSIRSFMQ